MVLRGNSYRPSKYKLYTQRAFKGFILGCLGLGLGSSIFVTYGLGNYYFFKRSAIKRQEKEYYEALLFKEKREQELGLSK